MPQITPCLWFDSEGLDAAQFYTSIFPNSEIRAVSHYTDAGPGAAGSVMTVDFVLDGTPFQALNGGPIFQFSEAISFSISCKDQAEADYYWDKLTAGGEESQCGWLKDRFGVSWQIVPTEFEEIMSDPDPERVKRAMQAMFGMKKLDVAALRAAADGA